MVELKPADYDPLTYGGDATIMKSPWLWRFSGSDIISLVSGLGMLICFFLPWVTFYELGVKKSYTGLDFVNHVDQLRLGLLLLVPGVGAILALRGFSYAMIRSKGVRAWPHAAVSMILGIMALGVWYFAGTEVGKILLKNHGVHILFNADIAYYATMFFAGMALASAITEAIEHMIWKRAVKKGVEERVSKFGMMIMPDAQLPDGVAKALGIAAATPMAAAPMPAGGDWGGGAPAGHPGPDFGGGAPQAAPQDWGGAGAQGGYQDPYAQQQGGWGQGQDQGQGWGGGGGGGWQQPPMDPKQRKAWEKQMRKMQKEQEKARKKAGGRGGGTPDFSYGGAPPPQF
jgi:hypothetical protein